MEWDEDPLDMAFFMSSGSHEKTNVGQASTDVGIEFRYVPLEIEIEIVHDFILMS